MAKLDTTLNLQELLVKCFEEKDPLLSMLDWLCTEFMEVETSMKLSANKHEHTSLRTNYRCGYRTRRFDTRLGTIYLLVPKIRKGGYIPFFVKDRQRSEVALIKLIQESYINGVSTRKIEKLALALGIENISSSQVSNLTKGLDLQIQEFRNRSLTNKSYPILFIDALYEKVRFDNEVLSMAMIVVCGIDDAGKREILAVEPMLEESKTSYLEVFRKLEERGLHKPKLIISDAHKGLVSAIHENFTQVLWQRCKVHFMRNILSHIPHKSKNHFAAQLKEIWLAPTKELALKRAKQLIDEYETKFSKAIEILEAGLESSLSFYSFPDIDHRKLSSTNMLERLNREIRRRTRSINIFPSQESYLRLVCSFLIEYSEDWGKKGFINNKNLNND